MIDWMSALADEIIDKAEVPTGLGGQYRNSVRAWIVGAIKRYSNVAYMPVPRCETCANWRKANSVDRFGHCGGLVDSSGLTHGSKAIAVRDDPSGLFARFRTQADFGCVQWKEKP